MKKLILSLVLLCSFFNSYGTHVMGADITYRMIDTINGTYEFTLTRYRYCGGINYVNNNLHIVSSLVNTFVPMTLISSETSEVTPLCSPPDVLAKKITHCPGPNVMPIAPDFIKGVMKEVLKCNFTIGRNIGAAYASYTENARNTITTIVGSPSMLVQTAFDTKYVNNSVIFTNNPVPYWCKLVLNTYAHGPADTFDDKYVTIGGKTIIRDSISYLLYSPFIGESPTPGIAIQLGNPSVTFQPGLNAVNFLYTTNGVTINPFTGLISATPDRDQDAIMAVAVLEWRAVPQPNGGYTREFLGYVCRDIQFSVRDNCEAMFSGQTLKDSMFGANEINNYFIEVCGRQPGKIMFKAIGAVNQNMILKEVVQNKYASRDLVNYKFTSYKRSVAGVDTTYGIVEFDSAIGSGDEKLLFNFYYCNNIGMKRSIDIAVRIRYMKSMTLDRELVNYCPGGKPVRIKSTSAKKVSWFPKTGIVNAGPDSVWVDIAPTSTTTYVAKSLDLDTIETCTIYDSVVVRVIPPFNYTLSPKLRNLCLGDSFSIRVNTQTSDTPYKYRWLKSENLYDPITKYPTNSSTNPLCYVNKNMTYTIEMENRFGCVIIDSVVVSLKGVVSKILPTANRTNICPGDTTMLSARISPNISGPTIYKSNSENITRTINSGSITYPALLCLGTSCYPNIFGTTLLGSSSTTRILYTKSQLLGAGLKAGIIKSIGFNITQVNVSNFDNFEIKIGGTSSNSSLVTSPLYVVYSKPISVNLGWNTYTFDRGFDWDGNSNILVEICVNNSTPSPLTNRYLTNVTPSGNEVSYRASNVIGVNSCDLTTNFIAGGGTQSKPHTRFNMSGIDSSDVQFTTTWSPDYLVKKPLIGGPRAIITANQTDSIYTITYGNPTCFGSGNVKVNSDTNFRIKAVGGGVICKEAGSGSSITITSNIKSNQTYTLNWTSSPNDVTMTGGNTGTIQVNPLIPGIYNYVVRMTSSTCEATDTAYLTIEDSIKISLNNVSPICLLSNGEVMVKLPMGTKSSEYNFIWTPNVSDSIKAINLSPNNYRVEVNLKNNPTCKGSQMVSLPAVQIPLKLSMGYEPIRCSGENSDSVYVIPQDGSGNYRYEWSRSSQDTFSKMVGITSGKYYVKVIDKISGCESNDSVTIPSVLPMNSNSVVVDVLCKGDSSGSVLVNTNGGTPNYSYSWTSLKGTNKNLLGINELFELHSDSLKVVITDKNGCQDSLIININEPDTKVGISLSKKDPISQSTTSGMVALNVFGGTPNYQVKWDSFNNTIKNWVTIKNSTNTIDTIKNLSDRKIRVTVIDQTGCITIDSISLITIPCSIKINGDKTDIDCHGNMNGEIYTYVKGNGSKYQYLWSNGETTNVIGGLSQGKYTVSVIDNYGCKDTMSFVINQPDPITLTIDSIIPITCYGSHNGGLIFKVVGGNPPYKFKFNTLPVNQTKFEYLTSKINYTFSVTDTQGCSKSIFKKIDEPQPIEFESIKVVNPSCYGVNDGIIEINVKGGTINEIEQYSYSIDGGRTYSRERKFTELSPKIFDIVVKDINECFVFRKVTLKEPPLIRVHAKTFGLDTIDIGESVTLYHTTSSQYGDTPITKKVIWTPNESLSCSDCDRPTATPYLNTTYSIMMTYNNNCVSSSKVSIVVKPIIGVYVPNAFSPGNQDGVNDVYRIFGSGIKLIDFKVFNRWGEKVFESNTQEKTWDGSFKNSPAPSGTYSYSLYVEYLNGFSETKKGTITLIR